MKINLKLEMNEVYGGDGIIRIQKMEKICLERSKKKTSKKSLGIPVDKESSETHTEIVNEKINTFRIVENKPVLRLGGAHGKLWGAMRATGKQLADLGEFETKSFIDRIMNMVNISPTFVPIGDGKFIEKINKTKDKIIKVDETGQSEENHRIDSVFTKMGGMGGAAIPIYFDVIEKTNVDLTLNYPDQIKEPIEKIVNYLDRGTHMNKMRASLKVLDFQKVGE